MHNFLTQFWKDENGFIISAELIIICTLLVLGLIVGLTSLQAALVAEFHDVSAAFSSLDQSFRFGGFFSRGNFCRSSAFTRGSAFFDRACFAGYANVTGDFPCLATASAQTVVAARTYSAPLTTPYPGNLPCPTGVPCPSGDCPALDKTCEDYPTPALAPAPQPAPCGPECGSALEIPPHP